MRSTSVGRPSAAYVRCSSFAIFSRMERPRAKTFPAQKIGYA
jgi:hypothetical protein